MMWEEPPAAVPHRHVPLVAGPSGLRPGCRQGALRPQWVPQDAVLPWPEALQLWPYGRYTLSCPRWHLGHLPGSSTGPSWPGCPDSAALPEALCQSGGWRSWSWAACPCATLLSRQALCSSAGLQDTSPPSLPGWGLKLQDCVNVDSGAAGHCCSAPLRNVSGSLSLLCGQLRQPLREAVAVVVPRWEGSIPRRQGQVCASRPDSTVFAFTQGWDVEAQNRNTSH